MARTHTRVETRTFTRTSVRVEVRYASYDSPIYVVVRAAENRHFVIDSGRHLNWEVREHLAQLTAACLTLTCTTYKGFVPLSLEELTVMVRDFETKVMPQVLTPYAGNRFGLIITDEGNWRRRGWLTERPSHPAD